MVMAYQKKKKVAATLRVEQFGLMAKAYLKKVGLRKTKGEKKLEANMKKLRVLSEAAERGKRRFAAELRKIGDEEGAAAVEAGMDRRGWQKFWTRERVDACRKSRKNA